MSCFSSTGMNSAYPVKTEILRPSLSWTDAVTGACKRSAQRHKRRQSSQKHQVIPDWELGPKLNVCRNEERQDHSAEHPAWGRPGRSYEAGCRTGSERGQSPKN